MESTNKNTATSLDIAETFYALQLEVSFMDSPLDRAILDTYAELRAAGCSQEELEAMMGIVADDDFQSPDPYSMELPELQNEEVLVPESDEDNTSAYVWKMFTAHAALIPLVILFSTFSESFGEILIHASENLGMVF